MALIVAFGVAVVATPAAMWLATRIGFVNEPGRLKVHERPIPYLGGVAVLVALLGPVAVTRPSLLIALVPAALLGLADDATDVPPPARIGAEMLIGLAAAWVAAPHDVGYAALGVVVVLVLVNAVNFLDGLDGLASSVAALGAVGSFVVLSGWSATLALALVGALVGFLVWNAPPAKVHLGDSGSYLIGTALALLFLAAAHARRAGRQCGVPLRRRPRGRQRGRDRAAAARAPSPDAGRPRARVRPARRPGLAGSACRARVCGLAGGVDRDRDRRRQPERGRRRRRRHADRGGGRRERAARVHLAARLDLRRETSRG